MMNLTERSPDAIVRDPEGFARDRYDLIVVGGGIYGTMLALEASRRRLSCLLLERDDFGSHTSFNHLRILHGGLRYLQSLDLHRFRDSVCERRWFLRFFPELTRPLDCLMPLSGKGLKRPVFLQLALTLDALLAWDRNRLVPAVNRLRRGRVLSMEELRKRFPEALPDQAGAALWQDGFAPDSPRMLIELLRWACAFGARALNYCSAEKLLTAGGRVTGVLAHDRIGGSSLELRAPLVINAAGPWCRTLADNWHADARHESLFPHRILVWNLLFRRPPLAKTAVALTPPDGTHTYFSVPWKNRFLVGTGHKLLGPDEHRPPTDEEIQQMVDHLNLSVRGADLTGSEVERVFWGVMPGTPDCRLGKRPVCKDHGREGGPKGLVSVSGIKFTTARQVADRLLTSYFPSARTLSYGGAFVPSSESGRRGLDDLARPYDWKTLAEEESAMTLADLVLRRSSLGDAPDLDWGRLAQLSSLFSEDGREQRRQIDEVWATVGQPSEGARLRGEG